MRFLPNLEHCDVSSRGAKILFGEPTDLPPEFELLLVHQGMRVLAEVRWQKDLHVGVSFRQIISPKPQPGRDVGFRKVPEGPA